MLGRIEARFGVVPDHRLLLEGDTVRRLSQLLERHPPRARAVGGMGAEAVAIIGVSCRFPGTSDPLGLSALADVDPVPFGPSPDGRVADRWVGGWLDDVAGFDAERFGLDPAEAAAMDPQQRLVLTLSDALLSGVALPAGREVGVFVGAGQQSYFQTVLAHLDEVLPPGTMAGNLLNMIAARTSHHFDLRGPALTVDTACSASLVAVQLAARSLMAGECTLAIAGGVNLNLSSAAHRLFEVAGALSPSGMCSPFAADADGMVPGEGAALLLLKPLERALADGDPVLGTIRGSAMNNDGASLGVMAPNPAGQEAVIRRALRNARCEAEEIVFVEAHGTGTPVGDTVESQVLDRCYPHRPRRGSVKGAIGHLLGAAGIAGLVRLTAVLARGELGAVSSFGFGGTNAHLILEGGVAAAPRSEPSRSEERHWLGEANPSTWVHLARADPSGGLQWRPCPSGPSPLIVGGTYLITGVTGALGGVVARWLARRFGADLVGVGRGDGLEQVRQVRALGGRLRVIQADLADPRALDVLQGRRFDGVFHLAGGLHGDALLAKTVSLPALDALGAGFLVLFSSISGVVPGLDRGIEAYAEANRQLDAFARGRRLTRDVVSVAWGPWAATGMAAGVDFETRGLTPILTSVGLAALEQALGSGESHVVVMSRPRSAEVPQLIPDDLRGLVLSLVAEAAGRTVSDVAGDMPLTRLGIDSVSALDLVRDLEQALGRHLPATLIYENATVDALVATLASGVAREDESGLARSGGPAVRAGLLPAQQTFAVQRAFFPDISGNVLLGCTLSSATGGLDRDLLSAAVNAIHVRHPVVGSAIRRVDGQFVQVSDGAPPELRWVDEVDEQQVHNEVFDLERGSLLRIVTDGSRLVLNAHHSVVDAWSLKNLLEDLLEAYERIRTGGQPSEGPVLEPLRTTWAQARDAASVVMPPDPAWEELFRRPLPPLPLPWDGPAARIPAHPATGPSLMHHRRIDRTRTADLQQRAKLADVTFVAFVLASYLRSLWRWTGQHDLAVRVAHGNRGIRLPDAHRIVGSFADSLPIRVEVDPGENLAQLAKRVHQALAWVQAHPGASAMNVAALGGRDAAGPVGLTPAGFSFPLLPAASRVGELDLCDITGASASGFTRLGLIAWVFDGQLHASFNAHASHFTPETLARLAAEWEQSLEPAPEPAPTLHGRVLRRCRAHPWRTAAPGLTYGQLDGRSGALASHLSGPRIGVFAPPGVDAIVGVMGVMRSGAAYVPLDPAWPDERVRQVLRIADVETVVAPAERMARAAAWDVTVVPITQEEGEGPDSAADTAYVMFTSGTTGRPKGVVVSHQAVLAFQDWVTAVLGLTEDDRFVFTSSIGFGGSIRQIYAPLLAGATVYPFAAAGDPDALLDLLQRASITVFNAVPSMWVRLMDVLERREIDSLPDLRWALLGGEAVPPAHVRRWFAGWGHMARLVNLYGSTEAIVNTTWFEFAGVPDPDEVHSPIGWPRAGLEVHLLDVHDGVGEIGVTGHIADGYLNDPEATALAFVDHPEPGRQPTRLYRTGDLASRRADGALVYLGRVDSQVQVRGFRVELGEIEHVLCAHPGVRHALVVQRDDGRLHAAVEGEVATDDLRAWIGDKLPAYMVPHTWRLGVLPRTAAGKRDRRAIAETVDGSLGALWREVLGLEDDPNPDDDFFALGGDSLLLLDLLERVRATRGSAPSPLVVYGQATLAEMSSLIDDAGPPPAEPSPPVAATGPVPLTVVQRGFWFTHRMRPEIPPVWTAQIPVSGPLYPAALQQAVDWLVNRHEILQMRFGDHLFQERTTPSPVWIDQEDLSMWDHDTQLRTLADRWRASVPMPLDGWPLMRIGVCRLALDRHQLFVTAHHIVADAWSAWILLTELLAAHDAFARGRVPALPPAPAFSAYLPKEEEDSGGFWRGELAGFVPSSPPARDRDTHAEFLIEGADWESVRRAAQRAKTTPFVLVLTALMTVLQDLEGTSDLVVSTAVAGRDPADSEALSVVGPYARGLPIRVREPATVQAVSSAVRRSSANAMVPPSAMVDAIAPHDVSLLGRFFLTWMDPGLVKSPVSRLQTRWRDGRYRFATQSGGTELLVGALVDEGLHIHLTGGPFASQAAVWLRARLVDPISALVIYVPDAFPVPLTHPMVVETVDTRVGQCEVVLLPRRASEIVEGPALEADIRRACQATGASVVSLAGMLPARTGLGARHLATPDQVLTTGHGATVVAMFKTIARALRETNRSWSALTVGVLGYGAVGRAVLALCRDQLGEPVNVVISDPQLPGGVTDLSDADLIIGATSGGRALDPLALRPGTIVIDDSFPRAFDDAVAIARMTDSADVLLIGGGLVDVGPLTRTSPFPQAEALRARYGDKWLAGCQAEAVLLAACPELGPTVGVVDVERARAVLQAFDRLGWEVPALHLGAWVVPQHLMAGVRH